MKSILYYKNSSFHRQHLLLSTNPLISLKNFLPVNLQNGFQLNKDENVYGYEVRGGKS